MKKSTWGVSTWDNVRVNSTPSQQLANCLKNTELHNQIWEQWYVTATGLSGLTIFQTECKQTTQSQYNKTLIYNFNKGLLHLAGWDSDYVLVEQCRRFSGQHKLQ